MKKALVILLALTMVMSMFAVVPFGASAAEELAIGAVAADYKPEGTAINTADDFAKMTADGKYYLAADITIDKTYEASFTGTFDGNGKTITTSVPVFAQFNGTAKNVTVAGSIAVTAGEYAGAFAIAAADATFTNILNKAILTSEVAGLGGIVGNGDKTLTFTKCANNGNITAVGFGDAANVGGIIANFVGDKKAEDAQLVIDSCLNVGNITADGIIGGIVGKVVASTKITNCVNDGKVSAVWGYAGGIVGRLGGSKNPRDLAKSKFAIENCTNNGEIAWEVPETSLNIATVGGIVGCMGEGKATTFKGCVNNADIAPVVSKKTAISAGGIVGGGDTYMDGGATCTSKIAGEVVFENCTNNGDIINESGAWKSYEYVGGITGNAIYASMASFKGCVNNGDVINSADTGGSRLAGGMVAHSLHGLEFTNCINNGDVFGCYSAGLVSSAKGSDDEVSDDLVIVGCGNTGDITGGDSVGGLVGAVFCYADRNLVITSSFNTGDIESSGVSDFYVSGLVGFCHTRDKSTVAINYCYVAGTLDSTNFEAVYNAKKDSNGNYTHTVYDVADITPGASAFAKNYQYKYVLDGTTYYFHLPYKADSVVINGTKVVPLYDFMENSVGGANGFELSDGETIESGKWCYFTADTGRFFAFKSSAAGEVEIDGENISIGGVDQIVDCLDVRASTQPTRFASALISSADNWLFKSYDFSNNMIADTFDAADVSLGLSTYYDTAFRAMMITENERFTTDELKDGTVAVTLNNWAGEDLYFQNLDSELFEVDAFPTTDKAHAKVVENIVGGGYTNPVFDETDDSGSPETGDATIYVVVALAVSTIALAGFMVAKKVKEN